MFDIFCKRETYVYKKLFKVQTGITGRDSPDACSCFIRIVTHFLISRPIALDSGGGTAFPTWQQDKLSFKPFEGSSTQRLYWKIILISQYKEQKYQHNRYLPVCVCPECSQRNGKCRGIPENVHTPSR